MSLERITHMARVACFYQNTDQEHLQNDVLPRFHDACIQALNEVRFFGTTNHYFDSKYLEEEICPPAFQQRCVQKIEAVVRDNDKSPPHPSSSSYRRAPSTAHFEQAIEEAKRESVAELNHATLMENQKRRVFAAVTAHFDVEKKTLVDNLLKKIKDILIKGHREWIERDLLRFQDILAAAKEDDSVVKLREDLRDKVKRLESCMLLLRDVLLPVQANEA
jgi:Holliday junction resolvase RusA-like endonuclease